MGAGVVNLYKGFPASRLPTSMVAGRPRLPLSCVDQAHREHRITGPNFLGLANLAPVDEGCGLTLGLRAVGAPGLRSARPPHRDLPSSRKRAACTSHTGRILRGEGCLVGPLGVRPIRPGRSPTSSGGAQRPRRTRSAACLTPASADRPLRHRPHSVAGWRSGWAIVLESCRWVRPSGWRAMARSPSAIRTKTGSILVGRALSGFLTTAGGRRSFLSVITNGHDPATSVAAIDDLVAALAGYEGAR